MNIEIGVGIGNSSLANLSPFDRLIAYAWASALIPSVSTSSVVHVSINAIIANSNSSALVPTLSSEGNTVISTVSAHANGDAFVPSVAIAGSISINAVIANSNVSSIIPTVSTIRNVSVGGIVANSTSSAGVPTVSVGGSANYYLQIDGVDDYISISFSAYDEVEIDVYAYKPSSEKALWGMGSYLINVQSSGVINVSNGILTLEQGGTADNRSVVKWLLNSISRTNSTFFKSIYSNSNLKADVYDIKLYNTGNLVAHYDMSTGTVLDQSGNGNDATLNGGTWVVA